MKIMFLFFILLIAGCSKVNFQGEITHEYDYILEQFNKDLNTLGYDKIDFTLTKIYLNEEILSTHNADALCPNVRKTNGGFVNIFVSSRLKTLNKTFQKYIIYHEIGHCFYGLYHQENGLMTEALGALSLREENLLQYLKGMVELSKSIFQ